MKTGIRNTIAMFLLLAVVCVTGCSGASKPKQYNMEYAEGEKKINYVFSEADDSKVVHLSDKNAEKVDVYIDKQDINFIYSDLYDVEECYKRIFTDFEVKEHAHSVLDERGKLNVTRFVEKIKLNNQAYCEENKIETSFYTELEDEYLTTVCQLILDTVEKVLGDNPDIDKERVYCNLGNLKVFYKTGMMDNAHVTKDMVLNISNIMFETISMMKGDNAGRNVIMHETMHMIQMGCACEEIENCSRRCGISLYWEDFPLNTADWGWFFEGSAERMVCNITGDAPVTYEYMINYLCSLNLSVLLRDDVDAGYVEAISFYENPERLFSLFDCKDKKDYIEIIELMTTINVLQMQPDVILDAYAQKYGVDMGNSDESDKFNYTIKQDICQTFGKYFYKNLTKLLATRDDVTLNDICYLVYLFEASMDVHLVYQNAKLEGYNEEVLKYFKDVRSKLFEEIEKETAELDMNEYYSEYEVVTSGESENKIVNASMKWCEEDKLAFMLERTEYATIEEREKIQ